MTTKPKDKIIIEEAKENLEIKENKETNLIETLQRLQAEFQNFQKRTEKEKQENTINANANLISELLEVLDNFELSLKHNNDKGIILIYESLLKILKNQGLEPIEAKGKFDPKFHEAITQEEAEEPGIILEEIQKGYLLNGKLLRASKVKISKMS
ncbi:MAG: nucleotide exchange factor GrpE [Nanoarchaeota archaeon]|nr:nucleotide exchange factor GrpE [Nanoarchaeota archaeon]